MSIKTTIKNKLKSVGQWMEEMGDPSIRIRRVAAERRGEEALKQYKVLRERRAVKEMLNKMKSR